MDKCACNMVLMGFLLIFAVRLLAITVTFSVEEKSVIYFANQFKILIVECGI